MKTKATLKVIRTRSKRVLIKKYKKRWTKKNNSKMDKKILKDGQKILKDGPKNTQRWTKKYSKMDKKILKDGQKNTQR